MVNTMKNKHMERDSFGKFLYQTERELTLEEKEEVRYQRKLKRQRTTYRRRAKQLKEWFGQENTLLDVLDRLVH